MAGRQIDGIALGLIGVGSVFVYSGYKGYSIPHAIQSLIQGQAPSVRANQIAGGQTGNSGGGTVVSGGSAQKVLQQTAAQFGWGSGQQWQSLQSLEMAEAGFNSRARNPGSGAFGLAQALGHGNANTAAPDGTNEYGGYGLSDAQARAANSGSAPEQALWMCNYIKDTYGDPNTAWSGYYSRGSWY